MYKLLLFLPFFVKEVIASNLAVMRLVFNGKVSPVIESVNVEQLAPFQAWILGTFITMTPGTLTIEYTSSHLIVQFLDKNSVQSFYSSFYRKFIKCC